MTTTLDQPVATAQARGPAGETEGRLVPAPPKARRRWGLFAAMAALICLGALGNVWLHQATTNAKQVVAARSTIERGSLITRDQLITVDIGGDPALNPVPASELASLVGQRAAYDVVAGSLLTKDSTTTKEVPATGHSLVGVAVTPDLMPGVRLMAGDQVRVVSTPTGQAGGNATPISIAAVVVSTSTKADTTGQGAQTIITVDVPTADAVQLASMASTGKVAVLLDSRDR